MLLQVPIGELVESTTSVTHGGHGVASYGHVPAHLLRQLPEVGQALQLRAVQVRAPAHDSAPVSLERPVGPAAEPAAEDAELRRDGTHRALAVRELQESFTKPVDRLLPRPDRRRRT